MKTLQKVLRDADPLGYERRADSQARLLRQQVIAAAPSRDQDSPQRRSAMVVILAITIAGIVLGSRFWLRAVPDVAAAAVRFEVRLGEDSFAPGLRPMTVDGGRQIYLHPEVVVTNSDIAEAHVEQGRDAATYSIVLRLTADGGARMFRVTQGHIGRPMAILIDGQIVMAPVVRAVMQTDVTITGDFPIADADRIVAGIIGR